MAIVIKKLNIINKLPAKNKNSKQATISDKP